MKRYNRHRRDLKKKQTRGNLCVRNQGSKETFSLVLENYKSKPQAVEDHESVLISQFQSHILRLSLIPVI